MRHLFLLLVLAATLQSFSQSRLQIIHNSADKAAESVDIYVNGTIYEADFKFREATDVRIVPSEVELSIDVAPAGSASASASVFNKKVTLEKDKSYIVVANGIVSTSGYIPATAFDLFVYDVGMTGAPDGKTNVMVFHGSTDAPTIHVHETMVPAGTIIDNLSYGDFSGYLELGTMDYMLDVRDETGSTTVASYSAPLATLGLEKTGLVVLASGFLDPSKNSDGAGFGLYVALPGGGDLVSLPPMGVTSLKQINLLEYELYPNPFLDKIIVRSKTIIRDIHIFDINGKKVMDIDVDGQTSQLIDMRELKQGQYLIRMSDVDNTFSSKTIIKR